MISTRDIIKQKAFTLFATRGYVGTSISDIAGAVGIQKSSLYSHFAGKEELFLAVYEDIAQKYGMLLNRLLEGSKDMGIHNKLLYHFEEYILFFLRNSEFHSFTNQTLFHVPPKLKVKLYPNTSRWANQYYQRLGEIFVEGMQQGIIRKGNPKIKVGAFKAMRDGVFSWMCIDKSLEEDCIKELWNEFWVGVAAK